MDINSYYYNKIIKLLLDDGYTLHGDDTLYKRNRIACFKENDTISTYNINDNGINKIFTLCEFYSYLINPIRIAKIKKLKERHGHH